MFCLMAYTISFFYWSSHKMEAKHCEFELGKYNYMFRVWNGIIPYKIERNGIQCNVKQRANSNSFW